MSISDNANWERADSKTYRDFKLSKDFTRVCEISKDFADWEDSIRLHGTLPDFKGVQETSWDSKRNHEVSYKTSRDFKACMGLYKVSTDFIRLHDNS
jgi:hypothetical protein